MLGLATGTVVGGRYALIRALSAEAEPQVWEATDTVRHLPVNVVALSSRHPQAAAVLDAARRAATIESSRLVRILDIGSGDGVTYFVEESLTGARSLSQLARDGGLAAEEVRRLTGEAATAGCRGKSGAPAPRADAGACYAFRMARSGRRPRPRPPLQPRTHRG